MRSIHLVLLLILAGLAGLASFWFIYIMGFRPLSSFSPSQPLSRTSEAGQELQGTSNQPVVSLQLTEVVSGLEIPWSIVFTSQQRMLVTERPGRVRQVIDGKLETEPLHTFSGVSQTGEEGLMGMALDPNYAENKYLYFAYAYSTNDGLADRVVRLTDMGDSLRDEQVLIESIPAARNHAGARVGFGPDGKLYITTGDATERQLAQDLNSLAGKILRINSDGTIPSDNPNPDSPIYSYGHRNPQGLDWHPVSQVLYSSEHGPSGNDGPGGGDEINVITAGGNYGWPIVSHTRSQEGLISPVQVYTPALAPGSGMFYASDVIPQFTHQFLFGGLRGQGLFLVRVNQEDTTQVLGYEKIDEVDVGRVREVVEGPDGAVYLTTSNRDGRGLARSGDDKIYKLGPVSTE